MSLKKKKKEDENESEKQMKRKRKEIFICAKRICFIKGRLK